MAKTFLARGRAIVLIFVLTGVSASANELPQTFTVYGLGQASCGRYLSDIARIPSAEESYSNWLGGYLSAFNRFNAGANTLTQGLDIAGALSWITNHCRTDPTENFQGATTDLLLFLFEKRK
jgi:hypothetical protein